MVKHDAYFVYYVTDASGTDQQMHWAYLHQPRMCRLTIDSTGTAICYYPQSADRLHCGPAHNSE